MHIATLIISTPTRVGNTREAELQVKTFYEKSQADFEREFAKIENIENYQMKGSTHAKDFQSVITGEANALYTWPPRITRTATGSFSKTNASR